MSAATLSLEIVALGFSLLVGLDLLNLGISYVNARNVGTDEAARTAATAAHRRLDQLLDVDRTELEELLDDGSLEK